MNMIHNVWHFQLFTQKKYGPELFILYFDSQNSPNPKVNKGFGNQLKAYREAAEYAKLLYNPADENPVSQVKINTFRVHYSDLPGHHQVNRILEEVNALNTKGLPRIIYPE